jgi:chaperone modulatory protein CbpM
MADSYGTQINVIVVEEEIVLTLNELCRASGSDTTQVFALVGEGVLEPSGTGPLDWIFDGPSLRTARTALRLARDFELGVPGVAMVLELLEQIKGLKDRLNRAGIR